MADITLKMDVDIKDAQSAVTKFQQTTQKAFNSSDRNVQSLGNQLNKTTQSIQNLLTKMQALANTQVPTERYTALQAKIKAVTKEYNEANKELVKLGKQREVTPRFQAATEDVNKWKKKLDAAQITLARLQNQGVKITSKPYRDALHDVANYTRQLKTAEGVQQQLIQAGQQFKSSQAYDTQEQKVKRYERSLTMLQNKQKLMEQTGVAFMSGDQTAQYAHMNQQLTNAVNNGALLQQRIEGASTSARNLGLNINWVNTIMGALSAGFRSAKTAVTTLFRTIRTLASTALRTVSKLTSHFSGPFKHSVNNAGKSHNMSFKKMLTAVIKYGFGIRSIFLLYKKVRTTISTGLTELAKQFEEVAVDVDGLKNSWSGFKSSIVSAFQPIFSYVVPALQTLINYLTSAMNALANFFAVLTGQGYYYKAKKGNESVAKSISGTGDAASDANEELAEYDELLVIDTDSGSGSGSGGSGSSDSDAWNWEKVETTASNWAQLIKEAFTTWDFTEIGDIIGTKITNALKSIPWNDVYATASNWGKGLATFLNGLISDDLFSEIGKTIANSLNTALKFLNSFSDWFKWKNLGSSIASGINSLINNADFKLAVDTANKWANGILTALITAVTNVEWKTLSNKIADAIGQADTSGFGEKLGKLVSGIADAIYTLVSNKKTWVNLGTKIAEGINAFFTNTEWEKLGATLREAFSGLITAITVAIDGIDWVEVGQAIRDFIDGIDWESIKFQLNGLKEALKDAFIDILEGLEIDPKDLKHDILVTLAKIALIIGGISSVAFAAGITKFMIIALVKAAFTQLLTRVGLGAALGSAGTATVAGGGLSIGALSVIADIALTVGTVLLGVMFALKLTEAIVKAVGGDPYMIEELKIKTGQVVLEKNGKRLDKDYREIINLQGEGDLRYKLNKMHMVSKDNKPAEESIKTTIQNIVDRALALTNTSLNINTDVTGDASSIDDLKTIDTTLGDIGSHGNSSSKLNFKLGGDVNSKNDLSDLTSSFKGLNSATQSKTATYSTELGGKVSQISDLDSWRVKFENLTSAWKDTKAVMSVNTGGEIQSINDLTGSGGWKDKFTSLRDSWKGETASFSTNFSLGDSGSWLTSLNNIRSKWTGTTEAKFKTSLTGVIQTAEDFTTIAEGFGKMSESFDGEHKATYNLDLTGESDPTKIKAYADAKSYLDEWWGGDGKTAKYSIDFSSSATDVKTYGNNILSKVYDALTQNGFRMTKKTWIGARGGILTKATELIAGEAGTEALVPLERNTQWLGKMASMISDELMSIQVPLIAKGNILPISEAFMNVKSSSQQGTDVMNMLGTIISLMQNRSDSDSNNQAIVLQLDSRTVAEVVWDETEKRYKQTGARYAY